MASSGETFLISCASLQLGLNERGQVISLVHAASGYDFLASQRYPVGLWQLALIRPVSYTDPLPPIDIPPEGRYSGRTYILNRLEYDGDLIIDSGDIAPPDIRRHDNGVTLTYTVPVEQETATVALTIHGGNEQISITAEVSLPPDWAIKRFTYPRMRGFGDWQAADEDHLLFPENWGILRRNPLEDMTAYLGQYPSAQNWCQMMAWLHGDAGVYIGVRDPERHHTGLVAQYVEGNAQARMLPFSHPDSGDIDVRRPLADRLEENRAPSMELRAQHWPEMVSRWASPYPVILQGFAGSWYDAAMLHRAWAIQQPWCRRGPLAEREDASEALANIDLWFIRYAFPAGSLDPAPAWNFQKAMHRLLDYFEMPFGVHWYNWHNFSWHTHFPSHVPPQEGFAEVVRDLQSRGVVIMPYCNGRLLYRDRPDIENERTHASIESHGQPYLEKYTNQDDWPLALCPGDTWAREQWRETARILWEGYGVEGVYFDQVTAMPPSLCYHAGHGHPLGGGRFYYTGYAQMLEECRAWIQLDTRRFLASELMADAFMADIDLYLSFTPMLEDYVPLFSAIYGDYTTVMGRSTPDNILNDQQLFMIAQGEQFVFGAQLGWSDDRILDYPEAASALRDMVRMRKGLRSFLHTGVMQRPLDLDVEGDSLRLSLSTRFSAKPRPVEVDRPAVRNAVWQSPEGDYLILLINEATEDRTVRFALPEDLPAGAWRLRAMGQADETTVTIGPHAMLSVPALTVLALVSAQ